MHEEKTPVRPDDIRLAHRTIPVADLDNLSRDELLAVKQELDEEIARIRTQVTEAKSRAVTEGIYADREWFRRAQFAVQIKGRQSQRIQLLMRKKRQEAAAAAEGKNTALGRKIRLWARVVEVEGNDVWFNHHGEEFLPLPPSDAEALRALAGREVILKIEEPA